MKDNRLYLDHILERIKLIEEFTQDGRGAMMSSTMAQEAVLRCFEVMGEAARKVPEPLKQKHSEVSWSQIIAFRNVLIHNYQNVDLNRVWEIIEKQLPILKPQIESILKELDEIYGADNDK